MPIPQENTKYTYSDYLNWTDDKQWELIEGVPYMQAAPTWQHQAISGQLLKQFLTYLEDKSCMTFSAPFDVRIPESNEEDEQTSNVVQPDIVVICNKDGLKGTGFHGTPSLIIEITSPSTSRQDKVLKFNIYEKAGVQEYWIVEPDGKFVSVFTLQNNNRYGRPETYTEKDKIKVSIFTDLLIDLGSVFASV